MICSKVVSLVARPAIDTGLMLFMTAQAPAHLYLMRAGYARHSCHIPMAGDTGEACADMHHVREIDEVRHPVDPHPRDRFFILPVGHELLDLRGVLGYEQVASPAVGNRRDAGNRRFGSGAMTEQARNSVVAGMDLVTEGDRLNRRSVPNVEWQNIHERKDGENNDKDYEEPADKPP